MDDPYAPEWQDGPEPSASGRVDNADLFEDEDEDEFDELLKQANGEADDGQDLYAILNVPRNASTETIKDRYRSLAVIFHPDKQRNPERKLAAESRFHAIQKAYEVLTDEHKRAVYDALGEEGLKANWEVGPKLKSPEELRAEYERLARQRHLASLESMIRSKGDITCALDATSLLASSESANARRVRMGLQPRDLTLEDRIEGVKVQQLLMRHSFEAPLTGTTRLLCAGQMLARGGAGGGNMVGTLRHQWSPRLSFELSQSILRPRVTNLKAGYQVDDDTHITVASMHPSPLSIPSTTLTVARRLYTSTTSFLSLRLPSPSAPSALTIGLTGTALPGWITQLTLGPRDNALQVEWGRRVLDGTVRIRVGAAIGLPGGVNAFAWGERKVARETVLGLGLNCGYPGGVTLRLRWSRLGQKIVIPILLSRQFDSSLVVATALIPSMTMVTLHHLVLVPRRRQQRQERLQQVREENAEKIREKRMQAEDAVRLMEEPASRKCAQEEQENGLVIVSASYGALSTFSARGLFPPPSSSEELPQADYIDVRVPLQVLVQNHQLVIAGGRSKAGLLGFFDPCMGEKKELRVRYVFAGRLHEVTVPDREELAIPQRAHIIE